MGGVGVRGVVGVESSSGVVGVGVNESGMGVVGVVGGVGDVDGVVGVGEVSGGVGDVEGGLASLQRPVRTTIRCFLNSGECYDAMVHMGGLRGDLKNWVF